MRVTTRIRYVKMHDFCGVTCMCETGFYNLDSEQDEGYRYTTFILDTRPLPVLLQLCNERASLPSFFLRADSSEFAVADLAYRPLELTPAALALESVLGNDPSSPIILNHSQTLIRDFVVV